MHYGTLEQDQWYSHYWRDEFKQTRKGMVVQALFQMAIVILLGVFTVLWFTYDIDIYTNQPIESRNVEFHQIFQALFSSASLLLISLLNFVLLVAGYKMKRTPFLVYMYLCGGITAIILAGLAFSIFYAWELQDECHQCAQCDPSQVHDCALFANKSEHSCIISTQACGSFLTMGKIMCGLILCSLVMNLVSMIVSQRILGRLRTRTVSILPSTAFLPEIYVPSASYPQIHNPVNHLPTSRIAM